MTFRHSRVTGTIGRVLQLPQSPTNHAQLLILYSCHLFTKFRFLLPKPRIPGFFRLYSVGTMSDMAAEIAQALLTAMDTEEPFRLLKTLPARLEELWAIEAQSASADVRDTISRVSCSLNPRLGKLGRGNIA